MSLFIHQCAQPHAAYVVLSSGLGGHASFWKPQIQALQQYFHVVSYDQEGCHADSALLKQPYSVDDMAEQLLTLLLEHEIHEFHFIGHALGGHIGMQLATKQQSHQIKILSLTMLNAWAKLDPHTQKCFSARRHLLLESGAEAYVRAQALFLYPPAWISKNIDAITSMENTQLLDFPPRENVKARLEAVQAFEFDNQHTQALQSVPIHLIANQDDFLVPVHQSAHLQSLLPHSQLSLLATGAHASTITETEQVNELIMHFMNAN